MISQEQSLCETCDALCLISEFSARGRRVVSGREWPRQKLKEK